MNTYFVVRGPDGQLYFDLLFEGETLELDEDETTGEPEVLVRDKMGGLTNSVGGVLCGQGLSIQEARLTIARFRTVAEVLES